MADTYFTEEQLKSLPVDTLVTITMTLQNNVIDLKRSVDQLTEQIRIMNQRMYGRKTEKESLLYKQEQLDLAFNETEVLADEDSEDEEPELQVVCHKRQKGQKEESLKKITNHRDEYIELSEEELEEKFGKNGWKKLPYQIVTKLEHIPASFEAVTYHIGVYAAKDNETIVRAEKPAELWEGSICTPTLLASIMVAKFVNSLPLYRQEAAYKANDVMISRRTMASWIIRAYDRYLQYFYNAMKKKLVQQTILHADETPFLVTKDGRAAGSKSYMWVYCGGVEKESENIILYDYCHTRGSDNPRRFLSEFKGILITDGYQAYHKLEKENPESFTVAGCWVHAKRKFSEIIKADKKGSKEYTLAHQAETKIQRIYHEDNKLSELTDLITDGIKPNTEVVSTISKNITNSFGNKDVYFEILNDENVSDEDKTLLTEAFIDLQNKKTDKFYSLPEEIITRFLSDMKIDGVIVSKSDQYQLLLLMPKMNSDAEENVKLLNDLPESISSLLNPSIDIDSVKKISLFIAILYMI